MARWTKSDTTVNRLYVGANNKTSFKPPRKGKWTDWLLKVQQVLHITMIDSSFLSRSAWLCDFAFINVSCRQSLQLAPQALLTASKCDFYFLQTSSKRIVQLIGRRTIFRKPWFLAPRPQASGRDSQNKDSWIQKLRPLLTFCSSNPLAESSGTALGRCLCSMVLKLFHIMALKLD